MMKPLWCLAAIMLLSGCSSQRIIIDEKGTDMSNYDSDLVECQAYADQVPKGSEVAKGTVGGALIGGTIGAIVDNSRTAGRAAGAGAVTGAVRGGSKAENEKDRVLKNCLRNRGYKILN